MLRASDGGRDAARRGGARRRRVNRHSLVELLSTLLGPSRAAAGAGGPRRAAWSGAVLALAAILMSWDAAPTLAQRFESVRAVLDEALPRRRRVGRTFQGFIKALTRHGAAILRTLAAALSAVRHAARTNPAPRALQRRLKRAVLDGYVRKGRKTAYRWPHKKNPPTPGTPTIARASP